MIGYAKATGALAALVFILSSGCGAVKVVSTDEALGQATNLDFEGGRQAGGLPNGWVIVRGTSGGRPQDYAMELDEDTARSGKASLRIRFTAAAPADPAAGKRHGGIAQCLTRPDLSRRELLLSGHLKVQDAADYGTGLWIQPFDEEGNAKGFAGMPSGVRGTTDWEHHEVKVSFPDGEDIGKLCFGVFLDGRGTAWADDLSLRSTGESRE